VSAELSAPSVEGVDMSLYQRLQGAAAELRVRIGRAAVAGLMVVSGATVAYGAQEAIDPMPAVAYDTTTGDYPWADATHVPQATAGDNITWGYTDKAVCDAKSDDYDCNSHKVGAYYTRDAWGYDLRNCTSYVAWRLAVEFGANASGMENATKWDNYAGAKGWTVDHTPEVGDIAHFEGDDNNQFAHPGHVALVTEVGTGVNAGKVKIAEYNQALDGNFRNDRWVVASDYIDVNGPNPPGFTLKVGEGGSGGSGANTLARPAAIAFNNALNVFIRGGDGNIYAQYWDGARWSGYTSIGGGMAGDPALIVNNNALSVFARGNDGQIYTKANNGSGWNGWVGLGGTTMKGNPSVVQYGSEVDVFALGTDGHPYKNTWQPTSGWGGWNSLGNYMDSSPKGLVYGSKLEVVERGGDNAVYTDAWNGTSWTGFNTVGGGGLVGNPDAIAYSGQLSVVSNATDNRVYMNTWNGSNWGGWAQQTYSTFNGDVDAMQYNNDLEFFARAADGHIYTRWWSPSSQTWGGWNSLGGNIAGDPTAIQYSTELDVFAMGADGKTYKDTFNPATGWGGFTALPG
jgi:surface antigen